MGSLDVLFDRIQQKIDIRDADSETIREFIFGSKVGTRIHKNGFSDSGQQRLRTVTEDDLKRRRNSRYSTHVTEDVLEDFSEASMTFEEIERENDIDNLPKTLTNDLRKGTWKNQTDNLLKEKRGTILTDIEKDLSSKRSLKSIRKFKVFEDKEANALVEERLDEFRDDATKALNILNREIFTLNSEELDNLDIDEDFFGSKRVKSINKAIEQRRKELNE